MVLRETGGSECWIKKAGLNSRKNGYRLEKPDSGPVYIPQFEVRPPPDDPCVVLLFVVEPEYAAGFDRVVRHDPHAALADINDMGLDAAFLNFTVAGHD